MILLLPFVFKQFDPSFHKCEFHFLNMWLLLLSSSKVVLRWTGAWPPSICTIVPVINTSRFLPPCKVKRIK